MKTIQNALLILLLATASAGLFGIVYELGFNWGFGKGFRSVPSVKSPEPADLV